MFRPECFVFPKENECQPGDRFAADDKDRLGSFVRYKPISFKRSIAQQAADIINLAAVIAVPLGFLWAFIAMRRRRTDG